MALHAEMTPDHPLYSEEALKRWIETSLKVAEFTAHREHYRQAADLGEQFLALVRGQLVEACPKRNH